MAGDYLRLRQICLATQDLPAIAADIETIFRIKVCHRDPNVAKYGLQNVIFAVGTRFLEVVAPIREGTAVGRFLERTHGHGGYMVIFDCSDPDHRRMRAEALGIRVVGDLHHDSYHGVQLHPRDCRAAMLEFNRTEGGENIMGPYWPAGPHWSKYAESDQTRALVAVEIATPSPADLARHWSQLIERPVVGGDGNEPQIAVDDCVIRFTAPREAETECFAGLVVEVADMGRARAAAVDRGYSLRGNAFHMAGVDFRLRAPA